MSRLLDERFTSRVLYGLITTMALLNVLELHPPSALAAIVTLLGTNLAVALAEAYSETIAEMLVTQRRPTVAELRHVWHEVTPIIASTQPSILICLLALVGVISVEAALQFSQAVVVGLLFFYGFRVGQLLHATFLRQIFTGLFMASTGLFIVLIKMLLH